MTLALRSPLAALVVTTTVVTASLSWAGWRLFDQQRAIDEQRAREQLESTADAAASRISRRLAESGEWLSGWLADPSASSPIASGAVAFAATPSGTRVLPKGGLPFVPVTRATDPAKDVFADIERLEFRDGRLTEAAARYRALARSPDSHVRAGAWLRLGRVLRRSDKLAGALEAYRQLAAMDNISAGELPAGLAGLVGQRAILAGRGERESLERVDRAVIRGLDEGRWAVTAGVASFYRDELAMGVRPESWELAAAVSDVWNESGGRLSARGMRVVAGEPRNIVVMWRSTGAQAALLAAFADVFLAASTSGLDFWRLDGAGGRVLAAGPIASGRPVARIIGPLEQPWTLQVWPGTDAASLRGGRAILLGMTAAVVMFVWAASYFIARAMRREAEAARLQSNFVSAVSHEFRSPLTAVRQMAEMLALDRVPTAGRRQTYYNAIAAETTRLQRLVETLLNFGRIEAGQAHYLFTEVDVGSVARTAAADFEATVPEAGVRIELEGPSDGPYVRADQRALALVLRNLVDNAVKYSPRPASVTVRWTEADGNAVVSVADRGAGIAPDEQRTIFRKFVRGRHAVEANVPGTGVGLAMVHEIVRAHAGRILVESQVGQGSTFAIVLPLVPAR